ncbi:Methyltransf-25 domain-containing protein [Mycena sanguinolenta]|uniref:Methyltransf-25 domain-containing protein n=1 Tax=Mycena sanguinolenta TaxID=230812 RepID=A0A8H6YT04_9AGAR|nr:Methyltransf-25 domain-containing protein [Mycena sanguinolenta]
MSRTKPDHPKFSAADMAKMEEITGVPAKIMLVQSGLLPTPPQNAKVLDNACGSGVLTSLLFDAIGNSTDTAVVCGDLKEHMANSAWERIKANGWNAEATVADSQALPFPDNHFSHNLMNFGMQLMPDPALAIKESFRVLKSGGTVGMTYWTAPGWLESFKIAVKGFDPGPMFLDGPESMKEAITNLGTAAGFTGVNVQPCKVEYTDDLSRYLSYMKDLFPILAGEAGVEYDAYMRGRYGDGDFTLTWEAIVVTAEKP